ncbi:DUF4129 domain-containing protein [Halobacillus litoralis]|uniref:DUF4129 domain-containing protein n=1 Tax=Halobacillus litoralis TaxID=45668 RepID=UPI001CD79A44|nr:DUF4129 domain-containing protein [Halobacillus litoralis]MCA0971303.1 DUF4129 domain-containing protein [Halobacillus litoralis]
MSNETDAKKQIEEILNQEEYQAYYDVEEGPLDSIREAIKEWLEGLLESIFPNTSINSPQVEGLIYLFGIVGVGLLLFLAFRLTQSTKRQKALKESNPLSHSSHLEWTYEEHLQEAESMRQKGNLKEAVRHGFLALLLNFNDQGYVSAQVWKSNGDYVEELSKVDRSLAKDFHELAVFFDQVTYGSRNISEEPFRLFDEKVHSLIRTEREDVYEKQ